MTTVKHMNEALFNELLKESRAYLESQMLKCDLEFKFRSLHRMIHPIWKPPTGWSGVPRKCGMCLFLDWLKPPRYWINPENEQSKIKNKLNKPYNVKCTQNNSTRRHDINGLMYRQSKGSDWNSENPARTS